MPVIFCGVPVVTTKKPVSGRQSFNEAIKKLAPAIEEARKNGHYGVQEIADYLNVAPNGRRFTYTTLHRILKRLEELGLTKGPRSVSEGASARRYRPRRARSSSAPVLASILREHPNALKGLRIPGSKPRE
jgi:DNA-binding Lrp family transcriptional regulator